MARRRFFADALAEGAAHLEDANAHHLARVLRAQPGQEYELAFAGRVYLARITAVRPARVDFAIVEELPAPAPEREISLAVALFKFDRFEWMIEKATELGVTRLTPLVTRRTDVKLAAAAPARRARWQQIARGAAEQSRRAAWPEIAPPVRLAAWLAQPAAGRCLLLLESPAAPPLAVVQGAVTLLAGPEGGWAAEEVEAAVAAGFLPVSLGPRILRGETAVLAALARLG
jgi:16S rRNA (uracil1498-N3)-methyltransferase